MVHASAACNRQTGTPASTRQARARTLTSAQTAARATAPARTHARSRARALSHASARAPARALPRQNLYRAPRAARRCYM
eukprot:1078491-Alexandrium_andersonii.AAC.1